jgi:fructokinase
MVPQPGGLYKPCCGGSPYNTVIALARLGAPAAFLAHFSQDFFGDMLFKRLTENNVDTRFITRTGENTMLAFVKLDTGGEPLYTFYTEGTASVSFVEKDIPKNLPPQVDCIYFGSVAMTMYPIGPSIETFVQEQSSRQNGPVISYDPNVRTVMIKNRTAFVEHAERLMSYANIVKISKADAEYIYPGIPFDERIEKILSIGTGVRLLVCTLGNGGALAVLKTGAGGAIRALVPIVDMPVLDTIGAGDTFHGAFLAFLWRTGMLSRSAIAAMTEQDLSAALLFANKAAALVCSREGADPPALAEVERLIDPYSSGGGVDNSRRMQYDNQKTSS